MTIRIASDAALSAAPTALATGSDAELSRLREHFDRHHWARLPRLLDGSLLDRILRCLEDEADQFEVRVHEGISTELVLKKGRAAALTLFCVNDPGLFDTVRRVTGCGPIGFFNGRIYRMRPGPAHEDSWHDDIGQGNLVAMSINLSTTPYTGGVLRIRDRRSEEVLETVESTGLPGSAILFRLDPALQHMVTTVEGGVPRTAYAGWFQSGEGYGLAERETFTGSDREEQAG